jgi:hypothetical protein
MTGDSNCTLPCVSEIGAPVPTEEQDVQGVFLEFKKDAVVIL